MVLVVGRSPAGLALLDTPVKPKTYTVNVEDPPETRWVQVLKDFKFMVPELNKTVQTLVPAEFIPLAEQIGAQLDKSIIQPFADEIKGVAKIFGLPLGEMVLLNIIYDMTAFCTSVVAQDSAGNIWHTRNLDYYYGDVLRNMTIVVNFQRNGKTVYTATTYAGYVGILTGQKPGLFSVSVDQRGHKVHVGTYWQNLLIAILDKNSQFVSFLVREVLENVTSFDEAVRQLSYRIIHAPVYYIVGGAKKGEGVVITRDRLAAVDKWNIEPLFGKWYILETNYDHWTTPPPSDNRRTPGIKAMDKVGQAGVNMTSLFDVMSTNPVMNMNTTYTAIMSAGNPQLYTTWIRWPKEGGGVND
ncbi:N-acylethanolamine-hydrolyzing acid amidase-like [Liolophura sinensis]|uniref:N-acylethanolamine-hydrolyzing acid amidase-like n=1 Tax=Liolophura sinensis TaxID=3198878 RepID=UPI0031593498